MGEIENNKNKSVDSITDHASLPTRTPLWGKALEDMYAAIVEEPLPQTMLELLNKLTIESSPGPRNDD
jgi:hypothetical protein